MLAEASAQERAAMVEQTLGPAGMKYELVRGESDAYGKFGYGPDSARGLAYSAVWRRGGLRITAHGIDRMPSPGMSDLDRINRINLHWMAGRVFHDEGVGDLNAAVTLFAFDKAPEPALTRAAVHLLWEAAQTVRQKGEPTLAVPPTLPTATVGDLGQVLRARGFHTEITRDNLGVRTLVQTDEAPPYTVIFRIAGSSIVQVSAAPVRGGTWRLDGRSGARLQALNSQMTTGALVALDGGRIAWHHGVHSDWLQTTDWKTSPYWLSTVLDTATYAAADIVRFADA